MNLSLLETSLNEDNYKEYVDKIINIFRLSNKESSIVFNINIVDYKAIIELSIIRNSGEKQEFTDEVFKCDEVFFQDFIRPLIKVINERVKIVVKDIIEEKNTDLVTFRMVTENNDLFTIMGLSRDDANSILRLAKSNNSNSKIINPPNNNGVGNALLFTFMIGVILITFIVIILVID